MFGGLFAINHLSYFCNYANKYSEQTTCEYGVIRSNEVQTKRGAVPDRPPNSLVFSLELSDNKQWLMVVRVTYVYFYPSLAIEATTSTCG